MSFGKEDFPKLALTVMELWKNSQPNKVDGEILLEAVEVSNYHLRRKEDIYDGSTFCCGPYRESTPQGTQLLSWQISYSSYSSFGTCTAVKLSSGTRSRLTK